MTALVPVDPSSSVAVTSYLEQARTWLATAVEQTGPEQIARAKAEIATAAEAAKQLNLSREIQDDAVEMVRRAEYALGKSIRKGQAEGTVREHGEKNVTRNQTGVVVQHDNSKASPRDFASRGELYGARGNAGILALADAAGPDEFDAAIEAAKADGNLSRANVDRKAREITGKTRKAPRRPINETARDAGLDLQNAVERISRVLDDDRFTREAEQVAPLLRNHLTTAIETLSGLLDRIESN